MDNSIKLALLFILALLISFILYKSQAGAPKDYISVSDGKLSSVNLGSLPDEGVSVRVKAESEDSKLSRDVVIRPIKEEGKEVQYQITDDERLSMEVSKIVRDINRSGPIEVELPSLSPEGTRLSWEIPERGKSYVLPLGFPILIMAYLYRGKKDLEKQSVKQESESVLKELPGFNNKLVLLMESGLIYEEAVERICKATSGESYVISIFSKASEEAELTNGRTEKLISDYAREKKLSELSRFISIVSESISRGTDLRERLRSEGEILWDKRKKQAEELGKLADTKLALPLGMMLVSLLIITAAPALMQF